MHEDDHFLVDTMSKLLSMKWLEVPLSAVMLKLIGLVFKLFDDAAMNE